MSSRVLIALALTVALVGADQLTTVLARSSLRCESFDRSKAAGSPCGPCGADHTCDAGYACGHVDGAVGCERVVVLIDGYLELQYFENPGSAFGMLRNVPGARYILIGVGLIALVVVWRMTRKVTHRQRMADVAFALVAGGAIGNIWDRVFIGRVVDFIVMHFHHQRTWPPYNVADVELVFGVALMVLVLGRRQEQGEKGRAKGKPRGKGKTRGKKR